MNCSAGRSKAFKQIYQRTFKVLFVASQTFFSLSDSAQREQNQ